MPERLCLVCDKPVRGFIKVKGNYWAHHKCMGAFLRREDGRIEWLCSHGIGHTIWIPPGSSFTHGCCQENCCKKLKDERYKS